VQKTPRQALADKFLYEIRTLPKILQGY
jgi:hypothetical protein